MEDLDYDQCPECRNFGVEIDTAGPMTFHCPDCNHEWFLPYRDDDDEDDD